MKKPLTLTRDFGTSPRRTPHKTLAAVRKTAGLDAQHSLPVYSLMSTSDPAHWLQGTILAAPPVGKSNWWCMEEARARTAASREHVMPSVIGTRDGRKLAP